MTEVIAHIAPTDRIEVGDILDSNWGYDQTNIDYYLVVGRTPKMATLQKIGATRVGESGFYHKLQPDPTVKIDKPFRRKVHEWDGKERGVSITSYAWASPWKPGSVQHETAAGFGH